MVVGFGGFFSLSDNAMVVGFCGFFSLSDNAMVVGFCGLYRQTERYVEGGRGFVGFSVCQIMRWW
jgi:hypothetical protein